MVRVGFHLHNDGQETVDCSRIIYEDEIQL